MDTKTDNKNEAEETVQVIEPAPFFNSRDFSSCCINFFFGAGVNGAAFPQMKNFEQVNNYLDSVSPDTKDLSFEERLKRVPNDVGEKAKQLFKEEFDKKTASINPDSPSIANLKKMFRAVNRIVGESENRIESMKQINIFTANYDMIVENSLSELGFLSNYISSTNLRNHDKFFNLVGYDFSLKKFVPSFLISKIHGDIINPILPGVDKFNETLLQGKFEVLFKMKEKLAKPNSILIVIGYSGNDGHLNAILNDCIEAGLSLYWFRFSQSDSLPPEIEGKVKVFEGDGKTDSTLLCAQELGRLTRWEK